MPARIAIDRYPPEFQRLTLHAIRIAKKLEAGSAGFGEDPLIRIPTASPGLAQNLMMQLRQYWNKLPLAIERGEISQLNEIAAHGENVKMLACRKQKGSESTIEIVWRSQLAGARAIAGVLSVLNAAIPPEPEAAPKSQDEVLRDLYGGRK